ncbi:hypothetical protein Tco_1013918 [Tanacetum coccineum]
MIITLPTTPERNLIGIGDRFLSLSLHLLSSLRIVTLIWRRSTYFLLQMTRCHRALRMTIMTSEGDIHFLEELLSNDSPPLPENESSNLDHFNDPSSSRPPLEPQDVEICFNFEPDTGVVTTKVVNGIFIEVQSERLLSRDKFSISFIRDPLSPVIDTLLSFSSKTRTNCSNSGDVPQLDAPYLHFYPP